MKFKLDENLGHGFQAVFQNVGHDIATVLSEDLSGATDEQIFEICCSEERCLITLDLDFADPVRFQSRRCGGRGNARRSGKCGGLNEGVWRI